MYDGIAGPRPTEGWSDGSVSKWPPFPNPPFRPGSRALLLAIALLAGVWIVGTAARFYMRGYYTFLVDYVRWSRTSGEASDAARRPTHIFLIFVDHFEPDYDDAEVRRWSERYRAMAGRHRDRDDRPPQHTWFYPGEQESAPILNTLGDMVADGFGEVELHFHHDYDTYDSLKPRLEEAIRDFQARGFLKTIDGRTRFAFVHGNSGLDNGNGPVMCGVNEELRLLRELGCFADFTFPSIYDPAQPPFVNTIYAAKDDPEPRSYRFRHPLADLLRGRADLMIFQGPLVFSPSLSLRHLFLDLDDGDVHGSIPASPSRADEWIRADVHVEGRPDWRFVKLFAHGISSAEDEDVTVGGTFDETLTYLERNYNDGQRYVLHYITAREAYNLAMAAAARVGGDPEKYYDYLVKPYVADRLEAETARHP